MAQAAGVTQTAVVRVVALNRHNNRITDVFAQK